MGTTYTTIVLLGCRLRVTNAMYSYLSVAGLLICDKFLTSFDTKSPYAQLLNVGAPQRTPSFSSFGSSSLQSKLW